MVRRRGDKSPEPLGGRAAERLRMFEEARRPKEDLTAQKRPKSAKNPKSTRKAAPGKKR